MSYTHSFKLLSGRLLLEESDIQKIIDLPLPNEFLPFQLVQYPTYKILNYSRDMIDYDQLIDLLPYSKGKADILVTWDSGIIEGFRVFDGKVTKCNVIIILEPESSFDGDALE